MPGFSATMPGSLGQGGCPHWGGGNSGCRGLGWACCGSGCPLLLGLCLGYQVVPAGVLPGGWVCLLSLGSCCVLGPSFCWVLVRAQALVETFLHASALPQGAHSFLAFDAGCRNLGSSHNPVVLYPFLGVWMLAVIEVHFPGYFIGKNEFSYSEVGSPHWI